MADDRHRHEARQALDAVAVRIGHAPLEQLLAELDLVDTGSMLPRDIAEWLNGRAYILALLGSTDEALEHLLDAEEILAADGDEGVRDRRREMLVSCVIGTRGIALLHAGSIAEAESELEKALALGHTELDCEDPDLAYAHRQLTAERLWWLSVAAERRGQTGRRLDLLKQAAALDGTPYGDRAVAALEPHS